MRLGKVISVTAALASVTVAASIPAHPITTVVTPKGVDVEKYMSIVNDFDKYYSAEQKTAAWKNADEDALKDKFDKFYLALLDVEGKPPPKHMINQKLWGHDPDWRRLLTFWEWEAKHPHGGMKMWANIPRANKLFQTRERGEVGDETDDDVEEFHDPMTDSKTFYETTSEPRVITEKQPPKVTKDTKPTAEDVKDEKAAKEKFPMDEDRKRYLAYLDEYKNEKDIKWKPGEKGAYFQGMEDTPYWRRALKRLDLYRAEEPKGKISIVASSYLDLKPSYYEKYPKGVENMTPEGPNNIEKQVRPGLLDKGPQPLTMDDYRFIDDLATRYYTGKVDYDEERDTLDAIRDMKWTVFQKNLEHDTIMNSKGVAEAEAFMKTKAWKDEEKVINKLVTQRMIGDFFDHNNSGKLARWWRDMKIKLGIKDKKVTEARKKMADWWKKNQKFEEMRQDLRETDKKNHGYVPEPKPEESKQKPVEEESTNKEPAKEEPATTEPPKKASENTPKQVETYEKVETKPGATPPQDDSLLSEVGSGSTGQFSDQDASEVGSVLDLSRIENDPEFFAVDTAEKHFSQDLSQLEKLKSPSSLSKEQLKQAKSLLSDAKKLEQHIKGGQDMLIKELAGGNADLENAIKQVFPDTASIANQVRSGGIESVMEKLEHI